MRVPPTHTIVRVPECPGGVRQSPARGLVSTTRLLHGLRKSSSSTDCACAVITEEEFLKKKQRVLDQP